MRPTLSILLGLVCCTAVASSQTAEELVARNLQAKGGVDKIKAIKSERMTGRIQQGSFTAQVGEEAKYPDMLRQTFTVQGMTQIQAYDGTTGWQISPFEGRKDPEVMGEGEDLRDLQESADLYGPLVDAQQKGNTIEYLGHDTVDGDDALKLKVTLKNGDIYSYYLDPETALEIRVEKQQFIRGAVRESVQDLGSYKQVAGVYFPYSIEAFPKNNPSQRTKITIDSIQVNVPIDDTQFKMPAAPATPSPQAHPEPPVPQPGKSKVKKPEADVKPPQR